MNQYDPIAAFLAIQNNAGSFISVANSRQSVANGLFGAINGPGGRKLRIPAAALSAMMALAPMGKLAARTPTDLPTPTAAQASAFLSENDIPAEFRSGSNGFGFGQQNETSIETPQNLSSAQQQRVAKARVRAAKKAKGGGKRNIYRGEDVEMTGAAYGAQRDEKHMMDRISEYSKDQETRLEEAFTNYSNAIWACARNIYGQKYPEIKNIDISRMDENDPDFQELNQIATALQQQTGDLLNKPFRMNPKEIELMIRNLNKQAHKLHIRSDTATTGRMRSQDDLAAAAREAKWDANMAKSQQYQIAQGRKTEYDPAPTYDFNGTAHAPHDPNKWRVDQMGIGHPGQPGR